MCLPKTVQVNSLNGKLKGNVRSGSMANAKTQNLRFAKLGEISILILTIISEKLNTTKNCVNMKVNANSNIISSGKTNSRFLKIPSQTPRHFGRL